MKKLFLKLENNITKSLINFQKVKKFFNLNVANLGLNQINFSNHYFYEAINDPYKLYRLRDLSINYINQFIVKNYPNSKKYNFSVSYGSTLISNLLGLTLKINSQKKKTMLTTNEEHIGGPNSFNKGFKLFTCKFDEDEIIKKTLEKKPDYIFLSEISYITGKSLNIKKIYKRIEKINKKTILIVDMAQSFMIHKNPFGFADVLFCSTHKWMCGPYGFGFLWIKKKLLKNFDFLDGDNSVYNGIFGIRGGSDFISLINLYVSLKLFYKSHNNITNLKNKFDKFLSNYFELINNDNKFMTCVTSKKSLEKFYYKLRKKNISVKFFKKQNIIRFSYPFFYNSNDIDKIKKKCKIILNV